MAVVFETSFLLAKSIVMVPQLSRATFSMGAFLVLKFLRVLIFAIFALFPEIRKNKFPHKKITANIFPAKIYSKVNIL